MHEVQHYTFRRNNYIISKRSGSAGEGKNLPNDTIVLQLNQTISCKNWRRSIVLDHLTRYTNHKITNTNPSCLRPFSVGVWRLSQPYTSSKMFFELVYVVGLYYPCRGVLYLYRSDCCTTIQQQRSMLSTCQYWSMLIIGLCGRLESVMNAIILWSKFAELFN